MRGPLRGCGPATTVSNARAHEIVGNRFFPATLTIDDPGVNDELAFPTISMFKTGDDPSVKQRDIRGSSQNALRKISGVVLTLLHKTLCPRRPKHDGRQRLPDFGNHIQISNV